MYDYLVIVPTCGASEALPKTFSRMVHLAEDNTLFVLSFNAVDKEEAKDTLRFCKASALAADTIGKSNVNFTFLWSEEPLGVGGAINAGFAHAKEALEELPECIIVLSDDCIVTDGWQEKLKGGLNAKQAYTETFTKVPELALPIDVEGQVGMVGPVSNGVYNTMQCIQTGDKGVDEVAYDLQKMHNRSQPIISSFLVGFCFALNKSVLPTLFSAYGENKIIDDVTFEIGGYEDNDLSKAVLDAGFRVLTIHNCFVGHMPHTTLDKHFPEINKGLSNTFNYYKKHIEESTRPKRVIGAYRVAIKTIYDMQVFASSLLATSLNLDGAAVLFTNNPAEALNGYDQNMFDGLQDGFKEFFIDCKNAGEEDTEKEIAEAFYKFLIFLSFVNDFDVVAECSLGGEFNERDERNKTHEIAEGMGAEYIFSIDSDEIFEDRVTRHHINKCVQNPNPDKYTFRVGWINHWESTKLVRNDPPFCNGYKHGQYGPRLWKVQKGNPLRIAAGSPIGLHCGNCPEYGSSSMQGTSIRFRHLSHVRSIDRVAKTKFYNNLDEQQNEKLLGSSNGYHHINRTEAVPVSIYNPKNGILFSMLAYERENVLFLKNWWDRMFNLSDVMCTVWTGEWLEEDQEWVEFTREQIEEKQGDWYKTGPSFQMAWFAKVYDVIWINEPLTEDGGLALCRNAGIQFGLDIIEQGAPLAWHLFMDPDEDPDFMFEPALVRAAEANEIYGFQFKYQNLVRNGTFHHSSSIRMTRLVPGLMMTGRVHETFEHSLSELSNMGHNIKIQTFEGQFMNRGLAGDPQQMQKKLEKYTRLLVQELKENPYDSRAWLSLGLQYANDGDTRTAMLCYERSCLVGKTAFMPWREAGMQYLREAKGYVAMALDKLHKGHDMYPHLYKVMKFLTENVPDTQKIETLRKVSEFVELPEFPDDKVMAGYQKLEGENGKEEST